uniref:Uncharacterized protein n=1 Tax=Candidatus Kentrum sp. MB TaxID=2138164 RepID=A0A450XYT1_9GAMM|nr:MAG: hypothetical protein BECKMB1821G_GA0114241_106520 [Candidatus Kentron sp. MB]VFK34403.1 MAG: hypothetical protein BECKMB1821I_GA0114274_10712 [Candidatus Kentron sp. MB]VFK76716.1 MAG: hypothetical protein BECKMB1821H_GA0114242_107020 [Candidatus Kentron sp. MB]
MSENLMGFMPVEKYFERYRNWRTIDQVHKCSFDGEYTLTIQLDKGDSQYCAMQVSLIGQNIFRVRFNPGKLSKDDFSPTNSRTIVEDNIDDLRRTLMGTLPFKVSYEEDSNRVILVTIPISGSGKTLDPQDDRPTLKIVIDFNPFCILAFHCANNETTEVWQTASPPLYYTSNGQEGYEYHTGRHQAPSYAVHGLRGTRRHIRLQGKEPAGLLQLR